MESHRHPFCCRHNLSHTRHIDICVFIKQTDHQTWETQLANPDDVFQHGVKLTRRITKITAAWANDGVNGDRHRLANGLQHTV
ncbi:hypothetical protein D3C81_1502650 [compost metagenome]